MSIQSLPREIIKEELHLSPIHHLILRKELYRIPYPSKFSNEIQESIVEEGLPVLSRFWNKMDLIKVRSYALRKGDAEVLEALRLLDYPFDSINDMIEAAEYGNYEAICYLRKRGISCNQKVMAAVAKGGHLSILKQLRRDGVPWNSWCWIFAARNCDLAILQYLYEEKCPIFTSILRYVVFTGTEEVLRFFLHHRIPIDMDDMILICAIASGNIAMVRLLDEHNITEDSFTTLSYSCLFNQSHIVDYYLSLPGYRLTSLHLGIAAVLGNLQIIQRCIEQGIGIPSFVHDISSLMNRTEITSYLHNNNFMSVGTPSFITKVKLYGTLLLCNTVISVINWIFSWYRT